MSLADVLTTGLIRVTDRMTECGVPPVEALGFGVDKAGTLAVDVLGWVEGLIPLEVQTRGRAKANMCAAFELGRDSVLERRGESGGYRPPPPRRRHLHAL